MLMADDIKRPFCKPICKPDAAKPGETEETQPTDRDVICPVPRDHRAHERLPETPETYVVLLITQRSRVQIPPPLLVSQVKALSQWGEGLLRAGRCSKGCSRSRAPHGLAARRGRRHETG